MYNQSENEDGQLSIFAEGGSTSEGIDLFEDYDNIPSKVQKVLDKYEDAFMDGSYSGLAQALKAVEKIGYTFEYYLDGAAYDLRPIGTKGKSEDDEDDEIMAKGGVIKYVFDIYPFGEDEDIDRKSKKVLTIYTSNRSKAYEKAKKQYPNHFVELADSYVENKMADGGMMAKGGMMDLKYPKFKAEEPEFTPEKEFKSPYSTFKSEAHWTVGGFNFYKGKDNGKADAYDWYNQIKDIDNLSDFKELSIKKEKELSSKNEGYIQYQVPEYVPSKVGQVFHFSSFKKAKKGEEFKFTYMNGGNKLEIEFVFDKIVLEKVLGWIKFDEGYIYKDYIYDDRENNACIGSGGAKLTLVSRKYADGGYMADGGDTDKDIDSQLEKDMNKAIAKRDEYQLELKKLLDEKSQDFGHIEYLKYEIESLNKLSKKLHDVRLKRLRDKALPNGNPFKRKMAEGGETENENFEMLESLIVQIKHHAKELEDVDNVEIEAWVLSKAQRAATDLSDITHYLDGKKAEKTMESGGYMAKGGDVKVVLDEGNGKVINQLYNQWNNVKNQNQYDKWVTKVKNTMFGTYGTISIEEVLEKFDFDNAPINSFHLNTFKKELKSALKKMADGGYMARGGGVEDKFKGKNSKEVWNNLDSSTRAKVLEYLFLKEKSGDNQYYDSYNSLNELSYSEWDKLPKNIKKEIENFKDGGYMAKGGGFNQYGEPYGFDRNEYDDMISEYDRLCAFYEDAESDSERERLNVKIEVLGDKINAIERMAKGGKLIGKQKNIDLNKNGRLDAEDFKMLRGEKMAMGSKVTFDDKVSSIKKSLLKKKIVSPKVQKDYGKTYNKKEALESAQRIAGAMKAKYRK